MSKEKQTTLKSFCSTCSRLTNHKVLKEEERKYHEEDTGWWDETSYQIIQCMGCDTISYRTLYNDVSYQQHKDEDTTVQELYPKRGAHSRMIKSYRNLPIEIKKVYQETIDAYNNNLTLLCSVGVRAILEGICIDKAITEGSYTNSNGKHVKSKNLDGRIYGLAIKGHLTSDNAEALHELRFLGNAAVHELATPSLDELSLAIDIIELVIDNIYELKDKAQKLMANRVNKKL
ncbi:hypothetical protein A4H97_34080 [Niastella yeongjuensis]|uniref:DUF4145 domain-containing protein n=1 Tax=Niastella yeongjuensis TaxID=354355 RepID=A0A1V9EBM1_9BACT|nr:DUF4145 domain-containing protein [Niastella yeongjuensis]OQP43325.1 hypothetical protein A4H97_34080 [Niastella yeongjuensis]SEP49210.1 protein of unknown function [Niastella yeongjuensis]